MKKIKKIYSLLIAAALMCAALALTGCGGGNSPYKVTVKDSAGNPCGDGVVVLFMQGESQVGMQVCDEKGVAEKELEAGDYTIRLQFTDSNANYYYEEGIKVTSKDREVEITLLNAVNESQSTPLSVGANDYTGYHIVEGTTYATFNTEDRTYFIFTPTRGGTYEFYVEGNEGATIGYYGAPHYVQQNTIEEPVDGKITVSISNSMVSTGDTGTSRLVLGVDVTGSTTDGKITVTRIGDPEKTIEDEEWIIYEGTSTLAPYILPEGATLSKFDLTAEDYTLVLNETDGFYHLNTADGPLVLVYLAEDSKYVACYKTILDKTGVNKYFFDENGEFIKKESYSECLLEYIECVDEEAGVYPLTEDLKYIIQQNGGYVGWFDVETSNYIFLDEAGNNDRTINEDIAWLFMCCYIAN